MFRARIFKISRWNKCFVQQSPASRFGAPVTEAGGPLRTGFETSGHVERTLEVDRIGGWQCVRDCENNRIAVVNLLKGSVECYSDFRYVILTPFWKTIWCKKKIASIMEKSGWEVSRGVGLLHKEIDIHTWKKLDVGIQRDVLKGLHTRSVQFTTAITKTFNFPKLYVNTNYLFCAYIMARKQNDEEWKLLSNLPWKKSLGKRFVEKVNRTPWNAKMDKIELRNDETNRRKKWIKYNFAFLGLRNLSCVLLVGRKKS